MPSSTTEHLLRNAALSAVSAAMSYDRCGVVVCYGSERKKAPAHSPWGNPSGKVHETLNLSATRLALDLRVPVTRIHAIINEKCGITPDTAMQPARYFGTSVEVWLNLQMRYDLEKAEDENRARVDKEVIPRQQEQRT